LTVLDESPFGVPVCCSDVMCKKCTLEVILWGIVNGFTCLYFFYTFMRVKQIIKYITLILEEVSVPPLKSLFVEYVLVFLNIEHFM